MTFRALLTENKDTAELIKTLKDYDATIVLHPNPSVKDVIYWAEGSKEYANDFASDFDMTEKEFINFCDQVIKHAKAITKEV